MPDVTHVSGCTRFCNSLICAFCVAPVLLLGGFFLLGWNEQRAVCEGKAITQGKEEVEKVGCGSATAGDGSLVMFSCDLKKDGLSPIVPRNSDFESVLSFVGTGLHTSAEMYQCIEHEHTETRKDSVGGGETKVTTYSYSREWRSNPVDSYGFREKYSRSFRQNCGAENPSWPSGLPESGPVYAPRVGVGAFTVEGDFVEKVPLDAPVLASRAPAGWTRSGNGYMSSKWAVGYSGYSSIGDVRVSFKGTDWSSPRVTVLGQNNGGTVSKWVASDSWLCSGFSLKSLRQGTLSRDDLFGNLKAESEALTMALRVVGFLLAWFALSRLAGPFEVAADCIPFIGPCLGDSIQAIGCCVSCLPACACSLGVIGIVWVVMRPLVGIPLIAFCVLTCCGFVIFKIRRHRSKQRHFAGGGDVEHGTDQPAAVAVGAVEGSVVAPAEDAAVQA